MEKLRLYTTKSTEQLKKTSPEESQAKKGTRRLMIQNAKITADDFIVENCARGDIDAASMVGDNDDGSLYYGV